jgi:hypothetical protein
MIVREGLCKLIPEGLDAFDHGVAEVLSRKDANHMFGVRAAGARHDDRHDRSPSSLTSHNIEDDVVVPRQYEIPVGDVAEPNTDLSAFDSGAQGHSRHANDLPKRGG